MSMPELPDVENYVSAIRRHLVGEELQKVHLKSPFVLRSVAPPLTLLAGQRLSKCWREAKQLVLEFEDGHKLLIHLMIAGRLRWRKAGRKPVRSGLLASLEFPEGVLAFTEAGKKKRARLHVLEPGDDSLIPFRKGGLEVLDASFSEFFERLRLKNHTLRRALTDQRILSGIGNAYSDEICFHAGLSPLKQTESLSEKELLTLYESARFVLKHWTALLASEVGQGFPEKVTAFHPKMKVHGRYQQDCEQCGQGIQRIRYAQNETNYCPACQNEGRLLADRSLSRLLKSDWPKTPEELEDYLEKRRV